MEYNLLIDIIFNGIQGVICFGVGYFIGKQHIKKSNLTPLKP